jgi:hypothetical protein
MTVSRAYLRVLLSTAALSALLVSTLALAQPSGQIQSPGLPPPNVTEIPPPTFIDGIMVLDALTTAGQNEKGSDDTPLGSEPSIAVNPGNACQMVITSRIGFASSRPATLSSRREPAA